MVLDVGQQDANGVEALPGVGADEPALAEFLVAPGGRRRPRGEVRQGRVLEDRWGDPPRQQMVAVDHDVEAAGGDRVHDRKAGRAFVDDRLRVVLVRFLGEDLRVDESSAKPCVPTGRKAGRIRLRACSQSCSGVSASEIVGPGGAT